MTDAEWEAMLERAAAAEYERDASENGGFRWADADAIARAAYLKGMRAALAAIGAREMMDAAEEARRWFAQANLPDDEDCEFLNEGGAWEKAEKIESDLTAAIAKARGRQ